MGFGNPTPGRETASWYGTSTAIGVTGVTAAAIICHPRTEIVVHLPRPRQGNLPFQSLTLRRRNWLTGSGANHDMVTSYLSSRFAMPQHRLLGTAADPNELDQVVLLLDQAPLTQHKVGICERQNDSRRPGSHWRPSGGALLRASTGQRHTLRPIHAK